MSLVKTVTALIECRGPSDADSLLPDCHGHNREQVVRALQNAAHRGLIRRIGQVPVASGNRRHLGTYASCCASDDVPQKRCVSCTRSFPEAAKYFFVKGHTKDGKPRLDYVCKACRGAIVREKERRSKAEFPLPILPTLTVWRGPVPAGYGVAA